MRNPQNFYKKRLGLALASSLLLLMGCGELEETADKAVKNAEEVVQSVATSDDPKVSMVKEGYLEAYSTSAIGEAFESYFSSPKWKYFSADKDQEVVEFTGYFLYEEIKAKANIQFLILGDGNFEVGAVSYNDLPQNELSTAALLASIFEEAELQDTEVASNSSEGTESTEPESSPETVTNQEVSELAMPLQLGATLNELINHYGEPTYDDYFMGSRLAVFEEQDGYFLDDSESITGFMISNPYINIYGAYIGMTLEEINLALAEPAETFYDDAETQNYVNIYYIDNYKIMFYSDTESGPTTSAVVIDNSQAVTETNVENIEDVTSSPYEWTPGFQSYFENEILERGYIDSIDTIRYEEAYVENNEGYLQVYAELGGTEYPIVKVNVKTGDFTGL